MQCAVAHRDEPIPRLRDRRSEIPETVDRLFSDMMAKDPAQRLGSMRQVAERIDSVLMSLKETRIFSHAEFQLPDVFGHEHQLTSEDSSPEFVAKESIKQRIPFRQFALWSSGLLLTVALLVAAWNGMQHAMQKTAPESDQTAENERANSANGPNEAHLSDRDVALRVLKAGGTVTTSLSPEKLTQADDLPNEPFLIREVVIYRVKGLTHDDLKAIRTLAAIEHLSLRGSPIRDHWLGSLTGLRSLKSLNLWDTGITNSALPHLVQLTNLEVLSLNQNEITGSGLDPLAKLPRLGELSLGRTSVSSDEVDHLISLEQLRVLHIEGLGFDEEALFQLGRCPALRQVSTDPLDKVAEKRLQALFPYIDFQFKK
jgi:hypothetical protein